jgi:hypothetical protein
MASGIIGNIMTKNAKPKYKLVRKEGAIFIPEELVDEHLKSQSLLKAADPKFIMEPKTKTIH